MQVSQRKFNFIMEEMRQLDLDQDNPTVVTIRENAIAAAEILTLKQLKRLIAESVELYWSQIWQQ